MFMTIKASRSWTAPGYRGARLPALLGSTGLDLGAATPVSCASDDLAARNGAGMSSYQLTSLLAEHMGRKVDVVLLPETRLRDKILREGEIWMPQA